MTFQPGQMLSHYRLIKKIGEGGMGIVFKALDTKLDRHVAIKVLPPDLLHNENRRVRFLREARAAAAVTHPNIATIHQIDEADGVAFLAMELLEGQTLRDLLSQGPMPHSTVLRIAAQMADGLGHAHRAGIVHRDLKPENVIVSAGGHAKILDFGLAKLRGAEEAPARGEGSRQQTVSAALTREGRLLGTAAYMSPEQARGATVDARSDLFSLGVMLYEMITGRIPFHGATPMDTLSAVLKDAPPPVSTINHTVPPRLEEIVNKALEKDPASRYQSAVEVGIDLRRLEATLSAPALPGSGPARRRWKPRFVLSAAAAALALAALFIALQAGWLRSLVPGNAGPGEVESLAVLPLEDLSGDPGQEYFADGMTEALITELAQISALKVISRTSVQRYKGTHKAVPAIGEELGVDAVVEGTVLRSEGRIRVTAQLIHAASDRHLWAAMYERDNRNILALQREVASAIAREIRIHVTPREEARLHQSGPLNPEAVEAYLRGRQEARKGTGEGLRRSLQHYRRAVAVQPGDAVAYAALADAYSRLSTVHQPPRQAMPQAREAALKALEIDATLAAAHKTLGFIHLFYDWDWGAAGRELRRALQLNPNGAEAHAVYGEYLTTIGRFKEGIAQARKAQELSPFSLDLNYRVGTVLFFAGHVREVIGQGRRLVEIGPGSPDSHLLLGIGLEGIGNFDEAVAAYQTATQVDDSPFYLAFLIRGLALAGKRREAEEGLRKLVASFSERYTCPYEIAMAHLPLGKIDQAFDWFEKAYQARADCWAYGMVDPRLGEIRSDPRYQDLLRRVGHSPQAVRTSPSTEGVP